MQRVSKQGEEVSSGSRIANAIVFGQQETAVYSLLLFTSILIRPLFDINYQSRDLVLWVLGDDEELLIQEERKCLC